MKRPLIGSTVIFASDSEIRRYADFEVVSPLVEGREYDEIIDRVGVFLGTVTVRTAALTSTWRYLVLADTRLFVVNNYDVYFDGKHETDRVY